MKAEIIIKEDGTKVYKRTCPRCRKSFEAQVPSQLYCSEACHDAYLKRKRSKSKSGKRYQKKHNVSRAMEGSSRALARKYMMYTWECIDALTGKRYDSWDFLQCHHLNLDSLSDSLTNLVPLSAESHAKIHVLIKEKFGKDIEEKLYMFGRGLVNFSSIEEYIEFTNLREEVVRFQLSMLQVKYGQKLPEYDKVD